MVKEHSKDTWDNSVISDLCVLFICTSLAIFVMIVIFVHSQKTLTFDIVQK